MGPSLLALVSVCYVGVAVSYWRKGQVGMALAFGGYVLANVGFILDLIRE